MCLCCGISLRVLFELTCSTLLRQVAVATDAESVVGSSASVQVGAAGELRIGDDATTTVGGSAVISAQKMRFDAPDSISAVAGHDLSALAKDRISFSTAGVLY